MLGGREVNWLAADVTMAKLPNEVLRKRRRVGVDGTIVDLRLRSHNGSTLVPFAPKRKRTSMLRCVRYPVVRGTRQDRHNQRKLPSRYIGYFYQRWLE